MSGCVRVYAQPLYPSLSTANGKVGGETCVSLGVREKLVVVVAEVVSGVVKVKGK